MHEEPVPLAQAAIEVQLAVELILLLEQQQLPTPTILAALEIVKSDFLRQAARTAATIESE
jgi:hypothetical protein